MPINTVMVNANDVGGQINIVRHPFRSATVAIASDHSNPAGAVLALDVMMIQDQWILGIGIFDAITQSKVNSITGPDQYAWTDVPCAIAVRVRRTDATAGNAYASISQVPA